LNQILDKSSASNSVTQVIQLNDMGTKKKDSGEINKLFNNENGVRDENVREALQFKDPINLSDIDSLLAYITSVTLKTLIVNLFDLTLTLNHRYIIDDLNTIVYTIGKEICPYLHILIPSLSYYVNNCNGTLNHEILQLLEMILKYCGSKFGAESQTHVDLVIDIILNNLKDFKYKEKCLDTLIALLESSNIAFIRQTIPKVQDANHLPETAGYPALRKRGKSGDRENIQGIQSC
jgi:hypothetical protein